MENHQLVLVLDFGGQYNQLIARRVREHNVYCEVKPYKTSIEEIKALNPIGIIFTGGPNSVYEESPRSVIRLCSSWAYRFWASATAVSLWRTPSAAR